MSPTVNSRCVNGVTIFDVSGRLTIGEPVTTLEIAVLEALTRGERNVLLRLADVTYVDSCGIGQLIGSLKTVAAAGGKLKLLNLSPRVEGLLRLTKSLLLFEVFEDEAIAVQAFGTGRS